MDLRNVFEPIALLKISQSCREMKLNDTLEIQVDDMDFHGNLIRLLRFCHVRVLADNKCAGPETGWRVIIQKQSQEESP
jgi:TusA-related sulfurtransferase